MNTFKEFLRALGRVEGGLIEIHKISERVRTLEIRQSWLRDTWAELIAAYVYLGRQALDSLTFFRRCHSDFGFLEPLKFPVTGFTRHVEWNERSNSMESFLYLRLELNKSNNSV